MSLTAGTRIGPYEVLGSLGAGGMGEVYRARDSKLKREVAIKVLPADVANDRERLARFQREAEVLASLNHPFIAHVYGIEDPSTGSGQAALVMELVEGEDLSQRIARGPIPVDEALATAKQIAAALEAAHDAGIVHRDLKPGNIKVRDDGTVKVLDFGLAKALAQGSRIGEQGSGEVANSPTITSPAMTMRGVILGTAAYMSPEQAKGKVVDKRADIWAFGCVLFEMVTGKRAFKGDDVTDIITSVMRDTPDWNALPAETPLTIRTLLRRCLEKDLRKRAPHMAIARLAIEDAMTSGSEVGAVKPAVVVPASRGRRGVSALLIAATAVVVALGGFAAWRLAPVPAAPTVVRFQIPTSPEAMLQANFNRQLLAVSPDGTQVVGASDALYIRSISEVEARLVAGTDGFTSLTHPAFSPDGKSIAFWAGSDRTLKRVTISTGAVTTLCPLSEGGYGLDWAGDQIYFSDNDEGIKRVAATGGEPALIIPVTPPEQAYGPQLLPGGDAVMFTVGARNMLAWDNATIVVESLRTKTRKVVLEKATNARYVSTGHLVFGRGGVLYAVRFDLEQLAVLGQPMAVVEGVRRAAPGTTGAVQMAVSDGGTLAYIEGPVSAQGAPFQIALFDHRGNSEPLTIQAGAYSHPRVSPDGTRVAMTVDDGKERQVWIYGLGKGSAARRLTFGGDNVLAEWSRDGERVAFHSTRDNQRGIWWQRADGADTAVRLTEPREDASHVPQSFSADKQHLLFDEAKDNRVTLWDLTIADRTVKQIAIPDSDAATDATFSPDGRWFAYTVRPLTAQAIVYVEPYPPTGARYQISSPGEDGHHPVWSRDGKELAYTPGPGNRFHVKSITTTPEFAFGDAVLIPRPFINAPPSSERTYDTTPDRRILSLRTDIGPDGKPMSPNVQVVVNWLEELKQRLPK